MTPQTVPQRAHLLQISACTLLACLLSSHLQGASPAVVSDSLRYEVSGTGSSAIELVSIKTARGWIPALSAKQSALRVIAGDLPTPQNCTPTSQEALAGGTTLLIRGACGSAGTFERRVSLSSAPDILDVHVRFAVAPKQRIHSVEDRFDFNPGRRNTSTPLSGPLDFVWSQNIKREASDVIPEWCFKSPTVMLQQGEVFAALLPHLSNRQNSPLALDLDVTSGPLPWISYGALESQPYGHSYFRRSTNGSPRIVADFVEYAYSIVASSQPANLGYQRVVRLLWSEFGHPELVASPAAQQNAVRPELELWDDWRQEAWVRYANEVYHEFKCGDRSCGTLASNRSVAGDWQHTQPDAWFNSWFQTLRTAYGWYLYGQKTGNQEICRKAESILNLALTSPRQNGAFSTIYLLNDKRWVRDDGWAGFQDSYHAFCMSWTAYWMLRWAGDLVPNRKAEILAFARPYGDLLLSKQLPSGVIPSWYDEHLVPRPEFRDFNAETAGSALLLAELSSLTGEASYLAAAQRAMEFVTREVLPRQRWFDFETFKSCARKPFDFYDRWTAQYPRNNLSTIQAAQAFLALHDLTHDAKYLERGEQVLDSLLLTQQVWSNPAFSPNLLGGFTTQNTDAEWSDARQCYSAVLLWDYYRATGKVEYLERAVAAAHSTFAVAPWENWAHTGFIDEPGALTGFHWGTGSAMTSVEIMSPVLGDAYIDVAQSRGVGFNGCSLRDVHVNGSDISFVIDRSNRLQKPVIHFGGLDPKIDYTVSWNEGKPQHLNGNVLIRKGLTVPR